MGQSPNAAYEKSKEKRIPTIWLYFLVAIICGYLPMLQLMNISCSVSSHSEEQLLRPSLSAEGTILMAHGLASNSATGTAFRGDKTREFAGEPRFLDDWELHADDSSTTDRDASFVCKKWSVVTTIFAPSAAVKRAALMEGWCTVIVADTKTPKNYMEVAGLAGDTKSTTSR